MIFLKTKVWPVVGGFIVASIIMLFFEWINHFIFAIPASVDTTDVSAVQAFTASLPWTAYILVFVGWAVGAFEGGCTTAWLSQDSTESGTDASRETPPRVVLGMNKIRLCGGFSVGYLRYRRNELSASRHQSPM